MVRMAQDWSMRYPLVDGQGNFGSMDGDCLRRCVIPRPVLQKITDEVMADIDKDTIDWTLQLRRYDPRTYGASDEDPLVAGERRERYRRRYGDQYGAAQSGRGDRCLLCFRGIRR